MTTTAEPGTLTPEQHGILSRFGAGMDVDNIVKHGGLPRESVSVTLMQLAGMNRQRAGALVREHDAAVRRTSGVPATNGRPVPAAAAPVPQPRTIETIEDLLDAAETSGVTRITRLSDKIRNLVKDLQAQLHESEKERVLRATIDELRNRLDRAQSELKQVTGKARPIAAAATGEEPTSKELRSWAAANGVPCPNAGRVPGTVLAAWRAAQEQEAKA